MLAGGGGYSAITPAATVSMNQEKGAHCHNRLYVQSAAELELMLKTDLEIVRHK